MEQNLSILIKSYFFTQRLQEHQKPPGITFERLSDPFSEHLFWASPNNHRKNWSNNIITTTSQKHLDQQFAITDIHKAKSPFQVLPDFGTPGAPPPL